MGERVAELLAELNEKNIRIEDLQVPYRKGVKHIYSSIYLFVCLFDFHLYSQERPYPN